MAKTTTAYIGIGSNLGDRRQYIASSVKLLAGVPELDLVRVSGAVETPPLLDAGQERYLNAVAEVQTQLDAHGVLKTLGEIEILLGRTRRQRWGPRTIDLDLLLFGDEIIDTPSLAVPHPQMHLRWFVLQGLCELRSDLVHPVLGETAGVLAARLNGSSFFLDSARPQLISIAGVIGAGKTTLAERLSEELGCRVLREPYDTNPFMPKVYAGRTELALDSQLYFLNGRVEQLNRGDLPAGQAVLSDYIFEKELIYARLLLNDEQLSLYSKQYEALRDAPATPVLVIYVRDSADNCLERIHSRNRPYEQQIRKDFIDALIDDYERLFGEWKACPVIRIHTSELDYSKPTTIERIASQVRHYTVMQGVGAVGRS
ncbi:MAG: 2-amino-4-hydroxy-6-hydroxymethyldihydropteridine diphosphokinase [Sedimentisphaerales bacterium]|nr:2-amino-4-hydroxy-6-hydroxymethyldihydropteridine diphosphokinase [Sedimentisphaerales bacterium]